MKRRDFLRYAGGLAATWPLEGKAQVPAMPVIGFLNGGTPDEWTPFVASFRNGLSEAGYVEGSNVTIEFRWAFGNLDQTPVLARDLVERRTDVIVASGGNPPILSAMRLTSVIPIIATFGYDPVKTGLVTSLERPGGNVTGVGLYPEPLEAKKLQLAREIVPRAAVVALFMDPRVPPDLDVQSLRDLAYRIGLQFTLVSASTDSEIDEGFAKAAQLGIGALIVSSTAYFLRRRDRFAALAARYAIPAIYSARPYVDSGGLASYGVDRQEVYRQLGVYTGMILKGEATPAEMPILQPTKYELVINLKTAASLGLTVPPTLLGQAYTLVQ